MPPPGQTWSLPTPEDGAERRRRIDVVGAVVRELSGGAGLDGSPADLDLLQRLLDAEALAKDDTYALQTLGLVLGDVLARELGLHWIVVEDEYGRDPALRLGETSIVLFPLTMISKRVERGERVDCRGLLEGIRVHVERIRAEVR